MKKTEDTLNQFVSCYFEANSFFQIHQASYILDYHNSFFNLACQDFKNEVPFAATESKHLIEFVESKEEFSFNPIDSEANKKNRVNSFEICNLVSDTFNTAYVTRGEAANDIAKTETASVIAESSRKNRSEKESEILGSTKLSAIPKACNVKKFDLTGAKKIQLKRKGAKEIITNEICSEERGSISGSINSSCKENNEDRNFIAISKIMQVKKSKLSQSQSIRRGQSTCSQIEYYAIPLANKNKGEISHKEAHDYDETNNINNTQENNKSYIASYNSKAQIAARESDFNLDKHSESYYKIIKNEIKEIRR